MEERSVLAVTVTADDATGLESALNRDDGPVSVRILPELNTLFDELCYSIVHCLLVPPSMNGTSAANVAIGVAGMYPDLPIVVAGEPDEPLPDDLDIRVVDADEITDRAVVDAIEDALDPVPESAASRTPSHIETMLHSMFDGFPVHLYAKDRTARHLMVSRHANEPTDLLGITDLEYDALPEEHREAAYRDEMSVIEREEPRLDIEEYTDYVDTHTLTSKVPWYGPDGDVVGLVGHTQDITERKQREHAARRQHEMLVKVALVAAHELRNELQVAMGRLDVAAEDSDQLDVVDRSHERLSAIVDTVVELATEEREQSKPRKIWLSTLGREIWDAFAVSSATLCVESDALVVADLESASLVLQILFGNALEHVGPDVTVTIGRTDDGFYVADDGDGIGLDPPERAFDAGVTTQEDGTGFGLFVARSIAADNGWTLTVSEGQDGGTRFDVGGVELAE